MHAALAGHRDLTQRNVPSGLADRQFLGHHRARTAGNGDLHRRLGLPAHLQAELGANAAGGLLHAHRLSVIRKTCARSGVLKSPS